MQGHPIRTLAGLLIGGFTGLSLTTAVIPFVASNIFNIFWVDIIVLGRGYTTPLALVAAVAGGVIGWYGGAWFGLWLLGLYGAVTGFILSNYAYGGEAGLVLACIAVGLLYAGIGGLIVGKVFSKPPANQSP
jgi:hypothetical protein